MLPSPVVVPLLSAAPTLFLALSHSRRKKRQGDGGQALGHGASHARHDSAPKKSSLPRWLRVFFKGESILHSRGQKAIVRGRLADELARAIATSQHALNEVELARSDRRALEVERMELNAQLTESTSQRDAALATAASLRSQHAAAESARRQLASEVQSMQEQLAAVREQVGLQTQTITKHGAERAALNERVAATSREASETIADLQAALLAAEAQRDAAAALANDLQSKERVPTPGAGSLVMRHATSPCEAAGAAAKHQERVHSDMIAGLQQGSLL